MADHTYGNWQKDPAGDQFDQNIYENTSNLHELQPLNQKNRFEKKEPKYLVALDLGSHYFSYSFAPVRNPRDITNNRNWGAEFQALKAPSVIYGSADGKR